MQSDEMNIVKVGANSITFQKSKVFARCIVNLCKHLQNQKSETVMSIQLLRSGTSIGANLAESLYSASRADFLNKIQISLKECSETIYWLDLLFDTGDLQEEQYKPLVSDCAGLLRLLTSTSKTSRLNQDKRI